MGRFRAQAVERGQFVGQTQVVYFPKRLWIYWGVVLSQLVSEKQYFECLAAALLALRERLLFQD